ncbi:hexose transporter Hxt15p [[Candida] anglica]
MNRDYAPLDGRIDNSDNSKELMPPRSASLTSGDDSSTSQRLNKSPPIPKTDMDISKPYDSFHENKTSSSENESESGQGSINYGPTTPPIDDHIENPFEDQPTTSLISPPHSFKDQYGKLYDHVDFDTKKYTSKLQFKGTRLVYFTSAFVSLFVSLFGYEQGVCSGILTYVTFNSYFNNPSPAAIGIVISILEIGAMVSSLAVSKISDLYGRKRTILLGTFIFIIGGTLQTFSTNLFIFGIGRVLSGIGVGILSTIVPSYQCEISPSEERGKLVCGEFTGNISGYCLSVWVDYFCYFLQDVGDARTSPHSFWANLSWRLPLFIQVILAIILFIGGFFIVESPRWLLDVDRDQQGLNVLSLLYDSHKEDNKPTTEFFMIKNSILYERITIPKRERSFKFMFKAYLPRILIACSALAFAQFNGINIISYYAPLVFKEAGFSDSQALLMTGINGLVYLISTIPPWFLVDKWGRKPILISGGLSMAACLFLISLVMYQDRSYTPSVVAFLVIVYNASFGYSWGPVGFLIPPEVYPLSIRSKGVSLSTASNWLANYIVGQLTPILQASIGWVMYLFPASSCIISIIVVWYFYPETKGIELEDIDKLFDEYYGKNKKVNEDSYYTELDDLDYEVQR